MIAATVTAADEAQRPMVGRWYRCAACSLVAGDVVALLALAFALVGVSEYLPGTRHVVLAYAACGLCVLALAAAVAAAVVSPQRIGRLVVRALLFEVAQMACFVTAFAAGSCLPNSNEGLVVRWIIVMLLVILPAVAGGIIALSLAAKAYFLHMSAK